MTPEALAKLWRRHGAVPNCDTDLYLALQQISGRLRKSPESDQLRYWGVIEERFRTQTRSMLHCFNFGNTSVKYPWAAEAVNFGNRLPLEITGSGTVRLKKSDRSFLHQMETPFLSFTFANAPMFVENLQPGYLLCEKGSGIMKTEVRVVLPEGAKPPSESGILFYFLTRRISFKVIPADPVIVPGMETPLVACTLRLSEPMILESGWPVLMLEDNHYSWGVVLW